VKLRDIAVKMVKKIARARRKQGGKVHKSERKWAAEAGKKHDHNMELADSVPLDHVSCASGV